MTFSGVNHIRTKIVAQDSPIIIVPIFKYLCCNITYHEDKELENEISLFQSEHGYIIEYF